MSQWLLAERTVWEFAISLVNCKNHQRLTTTAHLKKRWVCFKNKRSLVDSNTDNDKKNILSSGLSPTIKRYISIKFIKFSGAHLLTSFVYQNWKRYMPTTVYNTFLRCVYYHHIFGLATLTRHKRVENNCT